MFVFPALSFSLFWGEESETHLYSFLFLVAGHTKFTPDHVFALIANAYNREDLQEVCICSVQQPLKMA